MHRRSKHQGRWSTAPTTKRQAGLTCLGCGKGVSIRAPPTPETSASLGVHVAAAEAPGPTASSPAPCRSKLNRSATLVIPQASSLRPSTDVDHQILTCTRSLATQTELAVYIPRDLLPSYTAQVFGKQWLGGTWKTSSAHAELNTSYEGSGGSVDADDRSLPSYDELGEEQPASGAGSREPGAWASGGVVVGRMGKAETFCLSASVAGCWKSRWRASAMR